MQSTTASDSKKFPVEWYKVRMPPNNRSRIKLSKVCWSGKLKHFNWGDTGNWFFFLCWGVGLPIWYLSITNFITGIAKYNSVYVYIFRSSDGIANYIRSWYFGIQRMPNPHFTWIISFQLCSNAGCRAYLKCFNNSVQSKTENQKLQSKNRKSIMVLDERCKYLIGSILYGCWYVWKTS